MDISIVIPCFNEEGNIGEIHTQISSVMTLMNCEYEIIFVDDGSTDNSLLNLKKICVTDKNVKVLELSRNFGHQAAICAGLDHAQGDCVIMMDADMQHPPELIPMLVDKWKDGYEIVCTIRNDPPDTSYFKKVTAKAFYNIINKLATIHIPENSADFRLLDKKVVSEFRDMRERTKFLRGLINWVGFKKCEVHYDALPRFAGNTKYTLWKMIKFAFDGITSFSAFPLHVSTIMGGLVSFFSFLYAMYAVSIKLFTQEAVPGWTSVLVAVLFLGGVQLLSLGVIGEYLNRIYTEAKGRPSYIVRTLYGRGNVE